MMIAMILMIMVVYLMSRSFMVMLQNLDDYDYDEEYNGMTFQGVNKDY